MFFGADESLPSYTYTDPATAAPSSGSVAVLMVFLAFTLVFIAVQLVALWRINTKAGKPGWAALVPFYNLIVMLDIAGMPMWYLLLFFVPLVNIVITVMFYLNLAKVFGKSSLFAVLGLIFFTPVGYLMLAFGKAQYQGPSSSAGASTPVAPTPPATAPAA